MYLQDFPIYLVTLRLARLWWWSWALDIRYYEQKIQCNFNDKLWKERERRESNTDPFMWIEEKVRERESDWRSCIGCIGYIQGRSTHKGGKFIVYSVLSEHHDLNSVLGTLLYRNFSNCLVILVTCDKCISMYYRWEDRWCTCIICCTCLLVDNVRVKEKNHSDPYIASCEE